MAITLDQVEKLTNKTNVSYEEAKNALEQTDGDLLDAIILLEQQGKATATPGGFYATPDADKADTESANGRRSFAEGYKKVLKAIGRFLTKVITVGSNNYLDVSQDGRPVLSIPILAFGLLLIIAFWLILPLMLIGLFFRYRYQVRGKELGNEKVNQALDKTADAFQQTTE